MTVGEARKAYSAQLTSYNIQKNKLSKQKEELQEKIKNTPNGASVYEKESVTLELTYNAVAQKQEEYQNYMDQIMEQWNAKFDSITTKENAEAEKEGFEDLRKIMEVVRRMTKGDTVPSSDEKKVMEYDKDMYQMAKSAQMIARMRNQNKEKHDSLWKDEEKRERVDAMEAADGQDVYVDGPEIVSVEDTMAMASDSEGLA